jgi:ABC-2 type transport system ATP-binding protein
VNVLETRMLGKRYGRKWALRNCSVAIPEGRVVALVGPNGAGKTTLLHLAVGLTFPTSGEVDVLGVLVPRSGALQDVAFVAQDTPLYPYLTVADTLQLVRSLSPSWDQANAVTRLSSLEIPLEQKVAKLSGGQRAQVALAVALARRPRLLILDEPLARLDPLARHDFMATLMTSVTEDGVSILFSSHVVAELERISDYLVVLSRGQVQVIGEVEDLLSTHRVLTGLAGGTGTLPSTVAVVHEQPADRQTRVLVRTPAGVPTPTGWLAERTNLEELVLAYLREPDVSALPGPHARDQIPSTA